MCIRDSVSLWFSIQPKYWKPRVYAAEVLLGPSLYHGKSSQSQTTQAPDRWHPLLRRQPRPLSRLGPSELLHDLIQTLPRTESSHYLGRPVKEKNFSLTEGNE